MGGGVSLQRFIDLIRPFFEQLINPGRLQFASLMIAMATGLLVGLYIFYIYKRTYSGAMYNRTFNVSLILTTLVMALLLRLLGADPRLSLGMIGAVSLVRFRGAVKEPMDTIFILWAAAEGITIGAGNEFLPIAVFGAAVIGVLIYVMSVPNSKGSFPYMLIIRHDFPSASEVNHALHRLPRGARLKSRTVTRNGVEIIMLMSMPEENPALVNHFLKIRGVFDAKLVKMEAEYEQGFS
jgi:hypothetical protein